MLALAQVFFDADPVSSRLFRASHRSCARSLPPPPQRFASLIRPHFLGWVFWQATSPHLTLSLRVSQAATPAPSLPSCTPKPDASDPHSSLHLQDASRLIITSALPARHFAPRLRLDVLFALIAALRHLQLKTVKSRLSHPPKSRSRRACTCFASGAQTRGVATRLL